MVSPDCLAVMALARTGLLWLILMVVGVSMVGCGGHAAQGPAASQPLPKLSELAQSEDSPGAAAYDHGVVAVASIVRIWLPTNVSLPILWQDLAQQALSEAELEQWQANELSAAVVNRVDIPAFFQRLSANYGLRQQMLTLAYELAPLEPASGRFALQPTQVEIQGSQSLAEKGQLQFLIAADAQAGPWVKVTLVPHLHQPRVTIRPRPHTEAALDGRIYSELMLRALLAPGKVLLVAPVLPTEAFDDTPTPSHESDASTTQPAEPAEPPRQAIDAPLEIPEPTTQPPGQAQGLGRALLTGPLGHATRQQLLIIEAQRVATDSKPKAGQ